MFAIEMQFQAVPSERWDACSEAESSEPGKEPGPSSSQESGN